MEISQIKVPEAPHNIIAEQQLLGAVLLTPDAYFRVSDIVIPDLFHDPVHAKIWSLCVGRFKGDHLVSPVAMSHLLAADEGLAQLGGPSYLTRLAGAAVAVAAVRDYAMILLDCWQRRTMLAAVDEARKGILGGTDMQAVGGGLEAATQALVTHEVRKPSTPFLKALAASVDQTFSAYRGEGGGLLSGVKDLDDLMGGMFPADLVILAGGPSMGKTSLALAIAKAVAESGKFVQITSLEMTEEALVQRVLSSETRIPYFRLRSGDLSENEARKVAETAQKIQGLPMEITGPHVRDLGAIWAVSKQLKRRHDTALIVVDYLQLVRTAAKDRFQMVGEVSMGLKGLAKNLGVPVIALSQISRDVAQRDDKRPKLGDLRESAQIEQDADMVLFTHREHYYLEREGAPRGKDGKVRAEALVDHEAALAQTKGQMDLILAKHRSGAIGQAKVRCDITTNWFGALHDAQAAMEF